MWLMILGELLSQIHHAQVPSPVVEAEPWWVSIGKQIPAVIAIIFIVLKFLEHIDRSENKRIVADKERATLQKELTLDAAAASHMVRTSLDKNTEMLGRTGVALERMEHALESIADTNNPKGK